MVPLIVRPWRAHVKSPYGCAAAGFRSIQQSIPRFDVNPNAGHSLNNTDIAPANMRDVDEKRLDMSGVACCRL